MRKWKILLPIVIVLGLLGVLVTPAGATESYVSEPWSGACSYHVSWEGSSTNTQFLIKATNPNHGTYPCSFYAQGIWMCGLYGVPPTYYYQGTVQWGGTIYGLEEASWHGTYAGAACPTYSSDIILNWWIVVSAGPYANLCYNRNANTWASGSNGPGGVCAFSN